MTGNDETHKNRQNSHKSVYSVKKSMGACACRKEMQYGKVHRWNRIKKEKLDDMLKNIHVNDKKISKKDKRMWGFSIKRRCRKWHKFTKKFAFAQNTPE